MAIPPLSKRNVRRMKRIRALVERKQQRRPVMREWGNPKAFQVPFESLRKEVAKQLEQKILTAKQWDNFRANMNHQWIWKAGPAESQPVTKYNTPIANLIPREREKIMRGRPELVSILYNNPTVRRLTRQMHDPGYVHFEYYPDLAKNTVTVVVQVGKDVTPAKLRKRLTAFLLGNNVNERL